LADIVMRDARAELPVSNFRNEYNTYLSYPAVIGKTGVLEALQLNLTDEEIEKLRLSAQYIKTRFDDTMETLQNN
ncbi:MAG: L-lactate dehydrogenase, partial [Tetragenococcus halophilus]|nr:L-lactate dehydrogenase [Tetragenococcus halophilus]